LNRQTEEQLKKIELEKHILYLLRFAKEAYHKLK